MIWGIIIAILFLLVSGQYIVTQLHISSLRGFFTKIHSPLGYLFVLGSLLHLVVVPPLIKQRPLTIYLLGTFMVASGLFVIYTAKNSRRIKNAKVLHQLTGIVIAICLIFHVLICVQSLQTYQQAVKNISFQNIDVTRVADGQYVGEYDTVYVFAKVEVAVRSGKITKINLLEHRTEQGKPGEKVIDWILEEQNVDVDTVTSSTNSSKVIKKAVENALLKGLQ